MRHNDAMPQHEPPRRPPMARPLAGSRPRRAATGPGGTGGSGRREAGAPPPRYPGSHGRGAIPGATAVVGVVAAAGVLLLAGAAIFAGGSPAALASPSPAGTAAAAASAPLAASPGGAAPSDAAGIASPAASAGASPAPPAPPAGGPADLPLALVADVRDLRVGISTATLARELAAGRVAVPCGVEGISLAGAAATFDPAACRTPAGITTAVRARSPRLGLMPPTLVTPRLKVLQVAGADLFGAPTVRAKAYPVVARVAALPVAWAGFDGAQVRTLVSTGDTCPDRGVSHQANTLKKGWDWVLDGGTARYTGVRMDRRFDGPDGKGWPVVDAVRTGNSGAVRALVSDAEITIDDFECPMTAAFRQHDTGTVFSIDPRVASLLARSGFDAVTLASNHMTDQGSGGLRETLDLFRRQGILTFGAGMNLAAALAPAVIDVRGVRFAFVGFNEIPGSASAGPSTPGVAALEEANVRSAIAAARKVADVVIVVPQWGWPEYHADFTSRQKAQMRLFFDAGADQVIGHGTHWAAATSITKGERGYRFVISSHGNFLFGQDWSRQTQEGVIVELTFVGSRLAQARLHPYIMLDQAQANLTDPTTDGATVLAQVWDVSSLP